MYLGFASGSGSFVYRSTNSGLDWSLVKTMDYNDNVSSICVDPVNSNVYIGSENGVHKSTDAGMAWNSIYNGSSFYSITRSLDGIIYGSLRDRLMVSHDEGMNWENFSFGSTYGTETKNAVNTDNQNRLVYCGTDGGGILVAELSTINTVDDETKYSPREYFLSDNYPNPFNPEKNIRVEINKLAFTSLRIYNLKGQLVKTLVSEELPPGHYGYKWNGTNETGKKVSSGLYIYRLISGKTSIAKKMILIK